MKKFFLLSMILISMFQVKKASAQDRIFNNVYQSTVLNKSQKEIEVWMIALTGKENFYRQLRNRVEYEIGLGGNLQAAFYINTKQTSKYDESINDIIVESPEISFSNEWKYKVADPIANRLGFAGYFEYTIAVDEFEIELKAILDKKIGRSTHALNFILEPEWKNIIKDGKSTLERETKYNAYYGYSFQVDRNWNLGLECMYKNVKMQGSDAIHSSLFLGPNIAYNINKFWINFSMTPQILGMSDYNNKKALDLDEFTRLDTKILFSFTF